MKLMIPIAVCVKLATEMGVVDWLGNMLAPLMGYLGLPGIMGMVWAVTAVTNLWSGAMLFVSLATTVDITAAQATIVGIMMLMAHSLPLELAVVRKCGIKPLFALSLRVLSALILGYVFHWIFDYGSLLQEPVHIALRLTEPTDTSWQSWMLGQIESYILMWPFLFMLVLLLDYIKTHQAMPQVTQWLTPYLDIMGISARCAPITFLGMTLGLVYGGAMLIQAIEDSELDEDEAHRAVLSMNLLHAVIEDTCIIWLIGGSFFWIFILRLVFTLLVMRLLHLWIQTHHRVAWYFIKLKPLKSSR
tara:strand:- start:5843 stop:6751 length:909 start_codon:yes stop_codon:yes gene_type:complete